MTLGALTVAAATLNDAKALVEKAAGYYQANGKEQALKEFNNAKGQFVKGELFIFVYDMNGVTLAQPMNQKQLGVCMADVPDVDGKYFAKEALDLVKKTGTATVDYKFKNPVTGKVAPKVSYFKKVGDIVVGCGAYK